MSRQTVIPLLEWRQGAEQTFNIQTTRAMSRMSFDSTRFASLNLLLWISRLGAGSAAIVWMLGALNIQSAQANLPEQQAIHSAEPSLASLPVAPTAQTKERESPKLLSATTRSTSIAGEAVSQPIASGASAPPPETSAVAVKPVANPVEGEQAVGQPVTQGKSNQDTVSQPIASEAAAPPPETSAVAVKPVENPVEGEQAVGQPVTQSKSNQDLERSQPANQKSCTTEPTCSSPVPSLTSVVSPKGPNLTLAQVSYSSQTLPPLPVPAAPIPGGSERSSSTVGQLPFLPQPPSPIPVPATAVPGGFNNYPQMVQPGYYPQPATAVPGGFNNYPQMVQPGYYPQPATAVPGGFNNYPQMVQPGYYPQAVMMVPVSAMGSPMSPNGYPQMVQPGYYPQAVMMVPVSAMGVPMSPNGYPQMVQPGYYLQPAPMPQNPVGFNNYPAVAQPSYYPQAIVPLPASVPQNPVGFNSYPAVAQPTYYPQMVAPLPAPLLQNSVGFNSYPAVAQPTYYPQTVAPLPAPLPQNPVGFNSYPAVAQPTYYPQGLPAPDSSTVIPVNSNNYNPGLGQSPYYPQMMPSLPVQPTPNPAGFNSYNPGVGQAAYYPQTPPAVPVQSTPNPAGLNNYNPLVGQSPYYQQIPAPLPVAPTPITSPAPTPATVSPPQQGSLLRSTALTAPSLTVQGAYVNVGDQSGERARLAALYPLTPQLQFGATLDLVGGNNIFIGSNGAGLNVNELYFAAAPFRDLPNLRLRVGQLDLTSYFDRNSFAKDVTTHFFNPVFQTNPALSSTGIGSRPAALINWTLADNLEAKAAVFSSSPSLGDFALDGFAGEIGFRYGNGILRGTYSTDRDGGSKDGFQEIFGISRGNGRTGLLQGDRERAYGVNGEYFFPDLNMGVFGRYGRYENQALNQGGNTYSLGVSFLDLFTKDDRLGLAYGRGLSNEQLRRQFKDNVPDVLELFYDFRFLSNLRLGFTLQQRNSFSDTYAGFRVKTEFDVTPRGRVTP